MCAAVQHQRNQEATCHVSNLDSRVSEDLLWELFVQCGPISSVFMPKDKVTGTHYGYGFVEFKQASDAAYAHKIMNMVKLFSAPMRVSRSSMDRSVEIGANLFVGNLDLMVNEKLLYDTFSTFGTVLRATVRKGEGVGSANGGSGAATQFGFISYDSFEASDLAIQCMNGQFLCNRQVRVQYALKKGSKTERHGAESETAHAPSATTTPSTATPAPQIAIAHQ
ncbi:Splicing factor 3B subunit 4 [Hondaea fermentalgiana]|uniref:Splicing factor 3B subunit 4 n=1 Tax=Hondaea fermentalgiana TaxID=2315210 RepID=A0A2R5G7G8_9STRA|nr:Splicing factor 3B subunit 4 [Hondaea fermentalgiana]|eukprot:GBG24413.1 Splicing factor 3B subunit 4 [Hondaea fermentalgiana]